MNFGLLCNARWQHSAEALTYVLELVERMVLASQKMNARAGMEPHRENALKDMVFAVFSPWSAEECVKKTALILKVQQASKGLVWQLYAK